MYVASIEPHLWGGGCFTFFFMKGIFQVLESNDSKGLEMLRPSLNKLSPKGLVIQVPQDFRINLRIWKSWQVQMWRDNCHVVGWRIVFVEYVWRSSDFAGGWWLEGSQQWSDFMLITLVLCANCGIASALVTTPRGLSLYTYRMLHGSVSKLNECIAVLRLGVFRL